MNKKYKYIYFFVALFLIMTNPDQEQHQFAVNLKISKALREKYDNGSFLSQLGLSFGEGVASEYVKSKTRRQNLIFFSLTRINGEVCGIGLIDNVFLSSGINKMLKKNLPNFENNDSNSSKSGWLDNPDNSSEKSENPWKGAAN